ncbi:MAG TPA: UbiA family prenyltransferase [Trebonia sp.]|nr:UbiA family prenyltransferase [Trebonia sp.]
MSRVRALVAASHPGPCLAITALATLLAAQAAPHGTGPVLMAPAMLAGQVSVGWSNDAFDAPLDIAARRADKPVAAGRISPRAVWIAAYVALAAAAGLSLAIGVATFLVLVPVVGAAWAYNAGLKSTPASGLMYVLGFGPIPAYATTWLPGHPLPAWWVTVAAAAVGLGAHFANVLPDLAGDREAGVRGLPQLVAARFGPAAVRGCAIGLLLLASVALVVAARPGRRWAALAGLGAACVLAMISARGTGKTPFIAAIAIAGVDVLLFAAGVAALT